MKKVIKENDIAIYWLENKNPFFLICPWQGVHFRSLVEICQMYEISYEKTKMSLRDKFELSEEKAEEFMEKFWR